MRSRSRERTRLAIALGAALLLTAILVAVPLLVSTDPNATDLSRAFAAPLRPQ